MASGGTELAAAGDTLLYYYPQYESAGAALRTGQLPLWNPYQLCGHPWLATLQGGILYPFHAIYAFVPTWAGMALSSLVHLAIVALSTAILARRLGLSSWAALLAGALFCMQGSLPAQTSVPNLLEAATWLSPGAVAVTTIVAGRRARGVALLAFCLGASLLAGYPQYTVYACYTWAALLAVLLFAERRPPRAWLAPVGCLVLAVALGALVASPQLLASLELRRLSTRSLDPSSLAAMFPMGWPEKSVTASLRVLFVPHDAHLRLPAGLTGLLLLPVALFHRRRRLVLGLFALGLVVLGMAIGPASPLFDLYRLLPGTGAFRLPTLRLLLVVGFFFSLLAGFGLDELLRRLRGYGGEGLSEAIGALMLGLAVLEPLLDDTPRAMLPYTGIGYEAIYEQDQELYDRISDEQSRVLFWNPGVSPPLPPKLGSVFGMQVFDDYEPMSLQRQALYLGYLADGRVESGEAPPFFGRLAFPRSLAGAEAMASRRRLLDLAAVRFLVGTNRQRHDVVLRAFAEKADLVRQPPDERVWETGPVLYTNPHALPRTYVTYRTRVAPPADELLARLAAPDFDPLAASYVEGPEIGAGLADPPHGHPVPVERSSAREVEIRADLAVEGLVVLSDSFYPGWHATVDGEPAEILATNLLFRGVVVPSGFHTIVYHYDPEWLPVGGVAAAAGFAAIVGLAGLGRTRRPDQGASPQASRARSTADA